MSEYVIVTDSSCDLSDTMARDMGLVVAPLSLTIGEKSYYNYLDGRDISFEEFYKGMRAGAAPKTSAVNVGQFTEVMEAILREEKDILFLGFSSGLSATYQSGVKAIEALREKYPERKMLAVDTLCASMGEGLIVYLTAMEKKNGATIEEARDFAENNKMRVCHLYTVDDLKYLKRGGRISAATQIIGKMLNIKPVMHVDDLGKLVNMEMVQGRKAAIKRMKEKMAERAEQPSEQTVFISHGDCAEDANLLAKLIRAQIGVKEICINMIGPVIGSHSGPGTLALFFMGAPR